MSTSTPTEHVALKKLWWVGPLAIVGAAIANAVLRAIALAVLNPDRSFMPLQSLTFLPFTIIGVLGAVIVFALVARFARNPIRTYHIVAIVALLISLVPDLLLLLSPAGAPPPGVPTAGGPPMMGGVTLPNVAALMIMHVAAYAISTGLLTTLTREK
jgi:hypothetical protein